MSPPFKRVCVYCASSDRTVPAYGQVAYDAGAWLAGQGVEVVYGGGAVGLMGRVADGALDAGGRVIGVIPERLQDLELGYARCTELHVVANMHERKAMMADLSDAFVALPGGWGTWEELFEVTTWTQLGYHRKPVGVLNVDGYYDPLEAMLERAVNEGFVRAHVSQILQFGTELPALIQAMGTVELPELHQWLFEP